MCKADKTTAKWCGPILIYISSTGKEMRRKKNRGGGGVGEIRCGEEVRPSHEKNNVFFHLMAK